MVITKDLSRLGRDYIKTGEYLEKYFPSKNVRFIAVNDGYDSFHDENSNNEMAPFKAVFNDMYAKDISKKVRTALKTKQLKGEYLGTIAPFGYKKDYNLKGKLIIDEISSQYVKKIYELYLSGKSISEIASILSNLKIPTPSQYINNSYTQKYIQGTWNDKTVRFILKNEVYIGNTIQNKRKKVNYKVKKQIEIPQNQWIKVENTHEPIILKRDFDMVQELLKRRAYNHLGNKAESKPKHILSGLLFCGNCNAPMTFITGYKAREYYICCSIAKRYKKELNLCKKHYIKESEVNEKVKNILRLIAQSYINKEKIKKQILKNNCKSKPNYEKQLKKIERKILEQQTIKMNLYKDKIRGIITEKQFMELLQQTETEHKQYIKQVGNIKTKIQIKNNRKKHYDKLTQQIEKTLLFKDINKITLGMLINKIIINLDNSMEINLKFRRPNLLLHGYTLTEDLVCQHVAQVDSHKLGKEV